MKSNKPSPSEARGLRLLLRALRHRNYRLFFGGQGISLIGTWMQRIAMSWLVYRLTNSALLLGVVGFAGEIPVFLLAPLAGVSADRWNRHHILVITQTLAMTQAFILALLTLTGTIAPWHIITLSLFLGLVDAFDKPTRQSFVVEMVETREDLGNAIALNSFIFNSARLLGPSIAGILIAILGEGMCFLLNSISYLAVIIALLAMKITSPSREKEGQVTLLFPSLKEGFTYAFRFAPVRYILLLIGLLSLVGKPYTVLMPIFARDILHGGPNTLGFLMAAWGVGALGGAFYLASRKSALGLEKMIAIASTIFGCGLIAFSLSRVLWLSLLLLLLTGFGMMVQNASSNTVLQTIVDDDKRGRVMSMYTMAHMGTGPLGSLLAGGLASTIGAPNTLVMGGILCILGSLMFASRLSSFRKMVRPIFARAGIISEASSGTQTLG